MSAETPNPPDEDLLRNLEAFGMTLERQTGLNSAGGPIGRPESGESGEALIVAEPTPAGPDPSNRPSRRWWLMAAALAALVMGGATVAAWNTSAGDDGLADQADGGESISGDDATGSLQSDEMDDDQVGTEADTNTGDATGFTENGATSIKAADGTIIATIGVRDDGTATAAIVEGLPTMYRPYVELALLELIDDTSAFESAGWSPGMVDSDGAPLDEWQWLARAGLTVTVNLDPTLTGQAFDAVIDTVDSIDESAEPADTAETFDFELSVITVDPDTGAVPVFLPWPDVRLHTDGVDGDGTDSSADGRSWLPADSPDDPCCTREPGSAFKPIVLAAALEQGHGVDDTIGAEGPCRFPVPDGSADDYYEVQGRYQPSHSLTQATIESNNCSYVRLGTIVGNDTNAALAADLGVALPSDAGEFLSLPLGSVPVDWLEMTGAYATFAADGIWRGLSTLAGIESASGEVVWEHRPSETQPIDAETARSVNQALRAVVDEGTGIRAQVEGHEVAGKTGSTPDYGDAWFIGYTPDVVTTVWVGSRSDGDDTGPIELPGYTGLFGGLLPAELWQAYMGPVIGAGDPVPFTAATPLDREPKALTSPTELDDGGN